MSDSGQPPDADDFEPDPQDPKERERRRYYERAVPELVRRIMERALESGVEKLTEAPENLRDLVNELKLPKEASAYVYDQIDDTKKGVYRVVAKEIRDVLEHMNFADEVAAVLTKLSFEINTTIRFVPNKSGEEQEAEEEGEEGAGKEGASKRPSRYPRPKVVSKVVMKARDTLDKLSDDDR